MFYLFLPGFEFRLLSFGSFVVETDEEACSGRRHLIVSLTVGWARNASALLWYNTKYMPLFLITNPFSSFKPKLYTKSFLLKTIQNICPRNLWNQDNPWVIEGLRLGSQVWGNKDSPVGDVSLITGMWNFSSQNGGKKFISDVYDPVTKLKLVCLNYWAELTSGNGAGNGLVSGLVGDLDIQNCPGSAEISALCIAWTENKINYIFTPLYKVNHYQLITFSTLFNEFGYIAHLVTMNSIDFYTSELFTSNSVCIV